MSREIDEKIVQMKFENGQFEKGVQTSIHSLEELKKGLDFKDASKGLENLDKAAKGLKFDGLAAGIEALNNRFTLLGITGLNVMNRIANAAINTGEAMVRSLSTDQITAGWSKYADKTSAVQTIMSATAKEFTDTAEQMAYVNDQLEKLNWFTDETSYNFLDMVSNIGKFTSNNIPLDRSVTSMQGIATWAAQSGANANEASRAMYNLSQAISSGSLRLQDWMSIENANMGTARFKETVIDTALELGTLKRVGDKVVTTSKGLEVSVSNFRNILAEGWITSDVLIGTLDKYGAATNKLNEIVNATGVTTSVLIGYIDEYTAGTLDLDAASKALGITTEQTREYMESFQTETMKFGLEAFKTAQEAKTFAEAITAVRDAVSSGWMQTFEAIFGNYQEAKELWTDVANILYGIFAESGNARNELLGEWGDMGGRYDVLRSIYNLFAALVKILAVVKGAWRSVFPAQTAETLLELTGAIADFTQKLIISDEAAKTLQTALRGIFLALDTGRYILTSVVKRGFNLLKRVLSEIGIDISGLSSGFTNMMEKLNSYVKNQTWLTRAFDSFGDILVSAIRHIKSFVAAVEEFGPVKAVLDSLRAAFTTDFNGIGSVITFLGNTFANFINLIATTPMPKSLEEVREFFVDFGTTVSKEFDNAGINFSAFQELLNSGWATVIETMNFFVSGIETAKAAAGGAFSYISSLLKDVDWAGVTLLATGVAILYMLNKITEAVISVSNSLLAFTNIGKRVQDVMKGVANVLNSTAKVIESAKWAVYGAAMIEVAVAIGILSTALFLLSKVPSDSLYNSAFLLVGVAGSVAIFTQIIGSLPNTSKATGYLLSYAGVILAFTVAMNSLNVNNISNKIMYITIMLSEFVLACLFMSKVEKPIEVGIGSMLGIVASLWLLIKVLNDLSKYNQADLFKAVPLMVVLGAIVIAMSRFAGTVSILDKDEQKVVKSKVFTNLIGVVLAMYALVNLIKILGKMDPEVLVTGVLGLIPVLAAIMVLCRATYSAGLYASKTGSMILAISVALYLLIPALKGLAAIPLDVIAKGSAVIAALTQLIFKPLIKASQHAGANAAKAGLMLLSMAGTMAILQLVVKTLGKLDLAALIKGTAAVSILMLSLAPAIEALGESNAETNRALVKLAVIIGLVGAIVLILAKFTDPTKALASATSVAAIMAALVIPMHILDTMKNPDIKLPLRWLAIVGIISGIVLALSRFTEDGPKALMAAGSVSAILIALAVALKIMDKTEMPSWDKGTSMYWIVGIIGGIMIGLGAVSQAANPVAVLALTSGFAAVLLSLAASVKIMSNTKSKPSLANAKAMSLFVLAIGGVMVGLGIISKWADPVSSLALATGMSEILIALGLSARLMTKTKMPDSDQTAQLIGFAASIGIIVAALSHISKISSVIQTATAIAELVTALSFSIWIMGAVKNGALPIDSMWAMVGFATVAGVLITVLSNFIKNPNTILPIVVGLSILMVAMAGVVTILSAVPVPNIASGINALGILVTFVGGMGLLLAAIGAVVGDSNASELIANGGEVLKQIGIAIGGFIGGIVGGFIGGAAAGIMASFPLVCAELYAGSVFLVEFTKQLTNMPMGVLELIGTIVGVVAAITAAEFLSGLKALPGIGQILAIGTATLPADFASLGIALQAFADNLGDIDAAKVKNAADAVSALATATQAIPAEGGLFGMLFGDIDLTKFVDNVPKLGEGLAGFAEKTKGINGKTVEGAVNAASMLIELEKGIPRQDGALQAFIGEQDIGQFGSRLVMFGLYLAGFSNLMAAQLNLDGVEKAKKAGDMMISLENSLPRQGGVVQDWFIGNKDLGSFGSNLSLFGDGVVALANKCVDLDLVGISRAIFAGTKLSELENSLTKESGGALEFWFGGVSNFKSFGENLAWFGEGLRSLANKAKITDFNVIDQVIEFIETIGDAGDIGTATANMSSAVNNMVSEIAELLQQNAHNSLLEAKEIGKHIVDGIIIGLTINSKRALDSITGFAKSLVERFEDELKIHSPSVVMQEEGMYIVKGVAEGIEGDMSAEEAAEKKAQNIVSAFQTIFDNADLKVSFGSAMLESWRLGEGRGANWSSILQHEIDTKRNELEATEEKVRASYAKYITLKQSGANEKTLKEAEIDFIEMSNEWKTIRNDIIDAQIESAESMIEELDQLDEVRQAEYDRWLSTKEGKNASSAEKTAKEMELLVSQLDSVAQTTAVLRSKHQSIVEEFGENSTEAREAYVKVLNSEQKLNEQYDSIMEKQKGSYETIRQARDAAIMEYSAFMDEIAPKLLEMGFSMEQIEEQAKRESKFDQVWGEDVTGGYTKEELDKIMAKAEEPINLIKQGLTDTIGTEVIDQISVQIVDGIPTAIRKSAPAAKVAGSEVGQSGVSGFEEIIPEFKDTGIKSGLGWIEGLKATKEAAARASSDYAFQMLDVLAGPTGFAEQSPSKKTRQIGIYAGEGLINGLLQNGSAAKSAAEDVANNALSGLTLLTQNISSVLSNDLDLSPTITPVLDMDNIINGSKKIPGLLNANAGLNVSSIDLRTRQLQANLKSDGTVTSPTTETVVNNNFTQNNYSPKALSRYDIYRQTKNQIRQLKGVAPK